MAFGDNLRKFREDREMTQKELAERIGKTVRVVSYYETQGKEGLPEMETLKKIGEVLGVTVTELLGLEDEGKAGGYEEEIPIEERYWEDWELKELRERVGELTVENKRLKMQLGSRDREVKDQKKRLDIIINRLKRIADDIDE